MRVKTGNDEVEVSWWIEDQSRQLHLAVDDYVDGALADVPESFPVETLGDVVLILSLQGSDDDSIARQLWDMRPS